MRNSREVARGEPLPRYGLFARAQEGEPGDIHRLNALRFPALLTPGARQTVDVIATPFAELDEGNYDGALSAMKIVKLCKRGRRS